MDFAQLPKDPVILYSYINTKLRDTYENFDALCEDLDYPKEEILSILASMDFHYEPQLNQFR